MCVIRRKPGRGREENGDRCWFPSSVPLANAGSEEKGLTPGGGQSQQRGVLLFWGMGQCRQGVRTETSLEGSSLPAVVPGESTRMVATLGCELSHAHSDAARRPFSTWWVCGCELQDKAQSTTWLSLSLKPATPIS